MLRPHRAPRLRIARPGPARRSQPLPLLALLLALALLLPAAPAAARPQLWLPTPPGERWKIIQGYGCGTHNAWDRYSLDLVSADGRTRGAPVRAAADGRVWSWTARSGTLILDHGGGFYTMYTHMAGAATAVRGRAVARGERIGTVGDRGSPGTPHLHFTAFTGVGIDAHGRRSVPLSFAEGYDLPELGGCSQHGGSVLVAGGQPQAGPEQADAEPGFEFSPDTEAGRWYNADMRIEFSGGARGFSQAWNRDPGGDAPMFADTSVGYVQLAWAGEGLHTLYVRAWDSEGRQTLATYGPIGYDQTPPRAPAPIPPTHALAGAPLALRWEPADDDASGVAGYRVYIGADAAGTSDWFTPVPQVDLPALGPGAYLLRVQPLDYAGNAGEWATVGQVHVEGGEQ